MLLEELGQALAGLVEVSSELAQLIAVRHLHALAEIAGGDTGQRPLHLSDGEDERPRQDEPKQEGHGNARGGEPDDGRREQGAIGFEGRLRLGDLLVGRRDQPSEVGFEQMRDGMLLVEMELRGAGQVTSLVERQDPVARGRVGLVLGRQLLERRRVGRVDLLQLAQQVLERRLRVGDLGVELVLVGQEGHRPVVALGGDRVEHLLRPAGLLVEAVEVAHALVHPPDDHEAEDRHRDE